MMWSAVALIAISVALSFIITYAVYVIERRLNILSVDVHKPHKPLLPRVGGIALLIYFLLVPLILPRVVGASLSSAYPYIAAVVIAGLLGLIDDFIGIDARLKLVLFMAPSIPVILLHAYVPRPYVPLVGHLRLTIVYPLLLMALYTVLANGFNMSDTHNGTVIIVFLAVTSVVGLCSILGGPRPISGFYILLATSLSAIAAYAPFNMYPARLFNGNCGSHLLGALTASLIVMSRREFAALIALVPLILNGFSILASIRGFKSKERLVRPVITDDEGVMRANKDLNSPITLVQLLTLRTGLREREVVIAYALIYATSAILAVLLYYLLTSLPT